MDVVENILGKKNMIYWVEDINDPSIEFEESVSYNLSQTNAIKKSLEKILPHRRLTIRKGYDKR